MIGVISFWPINLIAADDGAPCWNQQKINSSFVHLLKKNSKNPNRTLTFAARVGADVELPLPPPLSLSGTGEAHSFLPRRSGPSQNVDSGVHQ
jgi:hypothetical protein